MTNSYVFGRCGLGQSINMFFFFPWDLHKFCCKILICLSLDKAKVLLHPLSLDFVVFIDMPNDNLRVTMDDD